MTQSRLDFEQWSSGHGHDTRRYFDGYYSPETQTLWKGWSARDDEILALSAKLAANKGDGK